jgi:predicted RNase H-like nuclease
LLGEPSGTSRATLPNINQPGAWNFRIRKLGGRMHVAGVDGCRAGWVCIHQSQGMVRIKVCETFLQIIDYLGPVSAVAVDIPIGLPAKGARSCDKAARKLLGWPRRNSVFSAPVWAVISETDYNAACAKHRKVDGKGGSEYGKAHGQHPLARP